LNVVVGVAGPVERAGVPDIEVEEVEELVGSLISVFVI
jgi:hypothetical protein